jgi:deoxyribonuclease-4
MGKSAMFGSLEDTLAMSAELPQVLPCMDFAHLHARPGDGSMNTYDEFSRSLEKYGKILGDESFSRMHIHLSGIKYSDKGEREHQPLRESDLDLKGLFKALKKFHCQGRILCESPEDVLEADAIYLKETWS